MKTIRDESIGLWARRLLVYVCGLFCIALGIAFSARSGLGVPPVGSPANVLCQIGRDAGLPESPFNLGNWTIAVYAVYILAQVAQPGYPKELLRRAMYGLDDMFDWLTGFGGAEEEFELIDRCGLPQMGPFPNMPGLLGPRQRIQNVKSTDESTLAPAGRAPSSCRR